MLHRSSLRAALAVGSGWHSKCELHNWGGQATKLKEKEEL